MLNLCNQLITFSPSLQTESPIRIVALGHSMANARDVADWLGAPPHAAFGFAPGEAAGLVCGCVGQRWGGGGERSGEGCAGVASGFVAGCLRLSGAVKGLVHMTSGFVGLGVCRLGGVWVLYMIPCSRVRWLPATSRLSRFPV